MSKSLAGQDRPSVRTRSKSLLLRNRPHLRRGNCLDSSDCPVIPDSALDIVDSARRKASADTIGASQDAQFADPVSYLHWNQFRSTPSATATQNLSTSSGGHSTEKAVNARPPSLLRLIRSFGHSNLFLPRLIDNYIHQEIIISRPARVKPEGM
jgi:hypothetical protein